MENYVTISVAASFIAWAIYIIILSFQESRYEYTVEVSLMLLMGVLLAPLLMPILVFSILFVFVPNLIGKWYRKKNEHQYTDQEIDRLLDEIHNLS